MTSLTVACQAHLPMGYPRQEYWSGLPFSSLEDLPNPRIELSASCIDRWFSTREPLGSPLHIIGVQINLFGVSKYTTSPFLLEFYYFLMFNCPHVCFYHFSCSLQTLNLFYIKPNFCLLLWNQNPKQSSE